MVIYRVFRSSWTCELRHNIIGRLAVYDQTLEYVGVYQEGSNMLNSLPTRILAALGYEVRKKSKATARQASNTLAREIPRTSTPGTFPTDPFEAQHELIKGMGVTSPTIFDVGANKGQTEKKYRTFFPDANIYCFEPFPDVVEYLKEQVGDHPGTKVVPMAMADQPGKRRFHVNGWNVTNSLLPETQSTRRYTPSTADPVSTMEVDVTTIDQFTHQKGIDKIDILKFDIQGGELMAFRGAAKTLEAKAVSLIYTEFMSVPLYEGNPLLYELWAFLEQYGYTMFDIYNLVRANNGQVKNGDAIFVSRQMREQVIDRYPQEP